MVSLVLTPILFVLAAAADDGVETAERRSWTRFAATAQLGKYSSADGQTSVVLDPTGEAPRVRVDAGGFVELLEEDEALEGESLGVWLRGPDGLPVLFLDRAGRFWFIRREDRWGLTAKQAPKVGIEVRRQWDVAPSAPPPAPEADTAKKRVNSEALLGASSGGVCFNISPGMLAMLGCGMLVVTAVVAPASAVLIALACVIGWTGVQFGKAVGSLLHRQPLPWHQSATRVLLGAAGGGLSVFVATGVAGALGLVGVVGIQTLMAAQQSPGVRWTLAGGASVGLGVVVTAILGLGAGTAALAIALGLLAVVVDTSRQPPTMAPGSAAR